MSFWLLYLMTRTEKIGNLMGVIGLLVVLVGGIAFVAICAAYSAGDASEGTLREAKRYARWGVAFALAAGLLSALMPSKQDWYVMIGGYYVTHIEGIDKLPRDTVAAIDQFLKEYTREPRKAKEGV